MHTRYMAWVQRDPSLPVTTEHCATQEWILGAPTNQQSSEAIAKSPDKLAILLKSLEQLLFQLGLLCG
jgi:hypothetical protein